MQKFNVGDRVVCTRMENPPEGIDLKKSYKIIGILFDHCDDQTEITLDNHKSYSMLQDFRITHEEAIGDRPPTRDQLKPEVALIDFTGNGHANPSDFALALLLFIKDTRLEMSPKGLQDKLAMPYEEKLKALEYVVNTIPSSWEFIDYTFMIRNVTRAFTHQLVRTRLASYAQQTMRTLDVTGWQYATGPTVKNHEGAKQLYDETMDTIAAGYEKLLGLGTKPEDARGILPTNILTNIAMKVNMRIFTDGTRKRGSKRTQDEYRGVVELMKAEVLRVHPWMSLFLARTTDKAMTDLENLLSNSLPEPQRTDALKLLLQVRGY